MLPITQQNDQMWVDARSLHQALGIGRDFSTWINARIENVGATENEEYAVLDSSPILGNGYNPKPRIDYLLSIDLAKEVAMLEKNDTGKAIRRYFIEARKARPIIDKLDLERKPLKSHWEDVHRGTPYRTTTSIASG